jgi:hypothetical protein
MDPWTKQRNNVPMVCVLLKIRIVISRLTNIDGAVMVDSAWKTHNYNHDDSMSSFETKTQALTVAFNGEDLHIYANHLTQGRYHSYPVSTEKPRFSFQKYKTARRQLRNAQDWARTRAAERREQIWTTVKRLRAISPDDPPSGNFGLVTPPTSTHGGSKRSKRVKTDDVDNARTRYPSMSPSPNTWYSPATP